MDVRAATNLHIIRTTDGIFTIAAFDHRASLAEMFGFKLDTPVGNAAITQLKVLFMEAFGDICSGILVDPIYGFPALEKKPDATGVILSLENSGYTSDKTAIPTLIPNWGVEHVKNNGAVAKIIVYFHPSEKNAVAKRQLLMELGNYCHQEGIAFLIEPIIYNPMSSVQLSKTAFQEVQLTIAQEFQQYCDVLKMEYPGDALTCATLTAELDIPWILLSRGMPYDDFVEALTVSMENGAKGFAAGRSVWQEISKMKLTDNLPDMTQIQTFLHTTGRDRMKKLIHIATGV